MNHTANTLRAATDDSQRFIELYVRVSTKDQAADGISLDTQEAELRRWAEHHFSGLPVRVWAERGASAYSGKLRPKYDAMLAAIERGESAVVVAAKPDRLNRSVTEAAKLAKLCHGHDTQLWTLSQGKRDTTAMANLTATMIDAFAEFESGLKSERVSEVYEYLRSEGFYVGKPPWGYVRDPGDKRRIIPSADHWIVRRSFELYEDGETVGAVVAYINSQPREERGPVRLDFVSKMLRNPTYAGCVPTQTKTAAKAALPGSHEPLCPPERWANIERRLRENEKVGYRGSKVQPFGHLARCGSCGGPLRHRKTPDGTYHYVACARGTAKGCQARAWPSWQFELAVVVYLSTVPAYIDHALADGTWTALLGTDKAAEIVGAELSKLHEGRESILRLVTRGVMSDAEADPLLRENNRRISELEPEFERHTRSSDELRGDLERLREAMRFDRGDAPGGFLEFWRESDHELRIRELAKPLNRVWMHNEGITLRFNYGLALPIPLPYTPTRHDAAKAAEAASMGLTGIGSERGVARNVPPAPRARSRGRSPSPPSAGPQARD